MAGLVVLLGVAGAVFAQVRIHTYRECWGWCEVSETELVAASTTSEGRRELRLHCGKCGADFAELQRIPVLSSEFDSSSGASDSSSSSDSGGSSASGSSDGGGGAQW